MTSQFLYSCLAVSEDRAGQDRLQPTVTQQTINGYTQCIATLIQMRNTANHWGSFYQCDSLGFEWMDDFWPQGYFPMSVFKSHSGWLPEKKQNKCCHIVVVHLGAVLMPGCCVASSSSYLFMFPHESLMCSREHNQKSLLGISQWCIVLRKCRGEVPVIRNVCCDTTKQVQGRPLVIKRHRRLKLEFPFKVFFK